ncbi:MAG: family 78 glycoside hydrolase catalytic domain [Lentisphaerae bacterium]|nr:family 78 glycoside hydrolase catalytic domain [Lentisphaerota bacterium]
MNALLHGALRIWKNAGVSEPNQYVIFRKKFTSTSLEKNLRLQISADSDFILTLDGRELGRGQFSDDPDCPTWSEYTIPELSPGVHILAVLVYHKGEGFSCYAPGVPGLLLALKGEHLDVVSDTSWKMLPHPAFISGMCDKVTRQLGFTAQYDARKAVAWAEPSLDDHAWPNAVAMPQTIPIQKRPPGAIPRLEPFVAAKVIRQGLLFRRHEEKTVALTMAIDQVFWNTIENEVSKLNSEDGSYSWQHRDGLGDGWAVIADLGREEVGFIEFELEAPEGCVVDFAHGEHLDDGRVRMECFGRNFADRYICRQGLNVFQLPFRRVGARYLQLHIMPGAAAEGTVRLLRVGLCPWTLPFPEAAPFQCGNAELLELRRLAIRTLELCMHEHYEDCPWREQSLYTYDSRNQMLYGYYLWNNEDFAAASLNLFGHVLLPDGQLRLCAPTRMTTVIPMYSLIWPIQVYEHYLYSGSIEVFLKNRLELAEVVDKALNCRDAATGLCHPPSKDYWYFYEWAPELSQHICEEGEFHSLYNLYLIEMLDAYAKLLRADGQDTAAARYEKAASELRIIVERLFYDAEKQCYATKIRHGKPFGLYHEHTQLLMLHVQAVPQEKKEALLKVIFAEKLVPVTLSVMPYLLMLFLQQDHGPESRNFVLSKFQRNYYRMLDGKSTSLWETIKGGDDFMYAGSLCHGWSSLPVYFCAAGLLGVMPLEPGFKRFRVRPWHGEESFAEGEIPTPAGRIRVAWQRNADGLLDLQVRHPAGLQPEISAWEDAPLGTVQVKSEP